MKCKNCNTNFKGKVCPNCNFSVPKKKLYKRWWFWVIAVFFATMIIGMFGEGDETATVDRTAQTHNAEVKSTGTVSSKYKAVTIESLFSELDANAMRAETNYKDKYVELDATISHINGDGGFITIRGYGNNYDTIKCWVKKEHLSFLMEKNEGERVNIKGKITHVSTTFGYTIDIDSISNASK